MRRVHLPIDSGRPIPRGWYAVGLSGDVGPRAVLPVRLGGEELVVFRAESGEVNALHAICPHLGAHLGHGGTVVGETVRCPFHAFRFDGSGGCVETGYGLRVPPKAKLRAFPVRERNGVVLVFWGPEGALPDFEIPEIDPTGWTPWHGHVLELAGHPEDIAENSVDVGHFVVVHGYRAVREIQGAEIDGARLHARYGFERPRSFFGQSVVRVEFHVHQWGLGYALVEVWVKDLGLEVRQLIMPQPVERDRVRLHLAISVKHVARPASVSPVLRAMPGAWLARLIAPQALRALVADVKQDVPLWEHKQHLPTPALAEGDGPIGLYRRWARGFYDGPAVADASA